MKMKQMIAAEVSPLEMGKGLLEQWATLPELCAHFGMSRTTVWRSIKKDGMPVIRLPGSRHMRFEISKVQAWLEQNERERFAAKGREATAEALRKRLAAVPVLKGIKIVVRDEEARIGS